MIKFTTQDPPAFATLEKYTGHTHPAGETWAHYCRIAENTFKLEDGDYVATDPAGAPLEVIRAAQAAQQAERIQEELARDVLATIRRALRNMALTDAAKADLVNRILAVYVLLGDGDLHAAKYMAENTATGGAYTAGRRTQLVALIDQAITLLP